jgi:protoporphyrinogen oxidase
MKVLLVGGGLSALAAGIALRRQGHETVIIEKEAELGGLAKCHRIDGYAFDYGPHYLFSEPILPLLRETLAPNLELEPLRGTKEKMYFRRRYFNFPFDPKDLLRQMEPKLVPGILAELIRRNIFLRVGDVDERNVEEWVVRGVGRRVYDYISLAGYIQKLYGLPAEKVSKDWGVQKLKFLSQWREASLFRFAMKALQEERRVKRNVIHYPPGGIDAIPRNLAATYLGLGGEARTGAAAVRVEPRSNRVSVSLREGGRETTLEGDLLISTIPIGRLVAMLESEPPAEVLRAASFLRHRSLLLVLLCLTRERLLDHASIYFTEPEYPFRRITEFKHLSPSMAPDGKTSLCIEITCFEDDSLWREEPERLFRLVSEPLERGGFLSLSDVESYHVLRVPFTYPVYEVGYGEALETLLRHLELRENVVTLGRQGLFFYNLMHNCMLDGYRLAAAIEGRDAAGRREVIQRLYAERREKYVSARSSTLSPGDEA